MSIALPFQGFPAETVSFLADLRDNNEREWFTPRKAAYERAVKAPGQAFAQAMADELKDLTGLDHRTKLFRVHRDVRFSKDKRPYNAHLHVGFMTEDEPGATRPYQLGWYVGLDPERLTVGAGAFDFSPHALDRYRARVAGPDGDDLAERLEAAQAKGVRLDAPDLKRVPSAYAVDHPRADLLKRKGLTVWRDYADPRVAERTDLIAELRAACEDLQPVFDWLEAG